MKIAIVGGGVAGLFSAWYMAKLNSEAEISVYDRSLAGRETTWKAAGMLAPVNELEFQELDPHRAGMVSRDMYFHEVAPELGEIGLRQYGTLEVGLSQDDIAYLRRLYDFQKAQNLDVEWLTGEMIQEVEPFVSRQITHAIWSHKDTQVDNWLLVQRLVEALLAMGVKVIENCEVVDWASLSDGGVSIRCGGEALRFDKLLLAVGVPGANIQNKLPYKIYPVRGELLSLEPPQDDFPSVQVRIYSKVLGFGYVVPKSDRILCGATAEEMGTDLRNTAGGMLDILRKCHAVVPAIYDMKIQQSWAGLRPSTLNRLPLLDQEIGTSIYHLNGLYRHGILLGPVLGKSAALIMMGQQRLPETEPFRMPA